MGEHGSLYDGRAGGDRRRSPRVPLDELVEGAASALLVQGAEIFDQLDVRQADGGRQRLVLAARHHMLLLARGPATLLAQHPRGLLRMPVLVLDVDGMLATVHCDAARAELEERRSDGRLGLALAISGDPVGSAGPWSATTLDVSAGGALVDLPRPEGERSRVVLVVGETRLALDATVVRSRAGSSALRFTGLGPTERQTIGRLLLQQAIGS